jgi:hypothetical protein
LESCFYMCGPSICSTTVVCKSGSTTECSAYLKSTVLLL